MYRLNQKHLRVAGISLLVLAAVVLVLGTVAYFKRENLLQQAIGKATAKARRDYNLSVKIGSARFTGFSTMSFNNITVVETGRDSLLKVQHFEVGVKLWPLLFGKVKLASVKLNDAAITLVNLKGIKNYDFLFKKKHRDTTQNSKTDLADLADKLVNEVLYKIPDELDVKNLAITYRADSLQLSVVSQATITDSKLTSNILVNGSQMLHLAGPMRPSDKYINLNLYTDGHKAVEFPFLQQRFGLKLRFDTLSTELKRVESSGGETRIYSMWAARNLVVNHARLSTTDIVVPYGAIEANLFVGSNYISVDSSSVIRIKDVAINPYVKYTLNPVKIYELKVHCPQTDAQVLFNSFPQGTFDALQGIKVSGSLAYDLDLYLDSSHPDDVRFSSNLQQQNFRILHYGKTDINKLNGEFTYTPYEKDKPMPPRFIGAANPNYTPIEQISPYLQHAVMTAEDPSFFNHHGFVLEAIRKSIAVDFKEKRFKRGGSTISMQLVKNAFLNRNKTITRKIEETLLVWMIENNRLISKTRMLEVYFNIIEWGYNVYGIGEAARYYFNKSPAELTVGESIYLASIVPKPKKGLYCFDTDGGLKPYIKNYFNFIGGLMATRGFTEPDTTGYGFSDVRLKESLRQKIQPADSLKMDLQADDEDALPVTDVDGNLVPAGAHKNGIRRDTTRK